MPIEAVQMTRTELAARISHQVDALREDLLRDTIRLIQFETVSGGSPEQETAYRREIPNCLAWLRERAESMGFKFRIVGGKGAGAAGEISWDSDEPNAPVFLMASHIDVVTPVGSWKYPPFSGTIAEGQVWGRGIQDDKGPLIQTLYGMHAARLAGIRPPCHVRILIGTQEETGDWRDVKNYVKKVGAPDYAFTPDANFPIINGEKGMMSIRYDAQWESADEDPDTGLRFVGLRGGDRENIVASSCEATFEFPADRRSAVMQELMRETTSYTVEHREARITLLPGTTPEGRGQVVLTFLGKGAHSSTPEKGHNAILDALDFLHTLEALPQAMRNYFRFIWAAAQDLDGTALDIASNHHFIGPTTVSLSLASVNGQGGSAVINIRHTMGITWRQVLSRCLSAARRFGKATGLQIKTTRHGRAVDAIYMDPASPGIAAFIRSLQDGFEAVTGRAPTLQAIGGTTYAKGIPNCCAFGPILTPDEPEMAHQADERFPVDAIVRNAKVYGTAIAMMTINR